MNCGYRVVCKVDSWGRVSYGIHEVFYATDGSGDIHSVSHDPIPMLIFPAPEERWSDADMRAKESLQLRIEQIQDGMAKPVVDFSSVGSSYAAGNGALR